MFRAKALTKGIFVISSSRKFDPYQLDNKKIRLWFMASELSDICFRF